MAPTPTLLTAAESRAAHAETLAVVRASNERLHTQVLALKAENKQLRARNEALAAQVAELAAEQKALAARLAAAGGSGPSSPPSSRSQHHNQGKNQDKRERPYPKRERGHKTSGGQPGHKGRTLARREPDEVLRYEPEGTCGCGADAADGKPVSTSTRQTIGVKVTVTATDHVAVVRRCACGTVHRGRLPDGVPAGTAVSYEPSARALVLALHTGGLLPTAVVADLADALAGLNLSEGTICAWAAGALDGFDAVCIQLLNSAGVLGADETPVKCVDAAGEPATVYVHAAVTGLVTRFHTGARSSAAIASGGIVGRFVGTLVSDCYTPCFSVHTGAHQLCSAHLVREARWWAEQHTAPAGGGQVPDFAGIAQVFADAHQQAGQGGSQVFADRLAVLVDEGLALMKGDGRKVAAPPRAFLNRLARRAGLLFGFVDDGSVPATNNAAERAVRPLKTKQKRSGRFRTRAGLDNHVRLAGYVDTARKHGVDPLAALTMLAAGNPWLPPAE